MAGSADTTDSTNVADSMDSSDSTNLADSTDSTDSTDSADSADPGADNGQVQRREFLAAVGVAGGLGGIGFFRSREEPTIDVRVWATEQAARYDNLEPRIMGYLGRAFAHSRTPVSTSFGGTVSVPYENAYRLMMYGRWPLTLGVGAAGVGAVDPVDDVNLLVTDSPIDTWPTGAGVPHIAAVGGADLLRQAPPADEVDDVVDDHRALRAMQILLHECGHALGLKHDHGSIIDRTDEVVVSPMVSGYAWETGPVKEREFNFERNRCGDPYPSVEGKRGRLLMRFAGCESDRIDEYDGGLLS